MEIIINKKPEEALSILENEINSDKYDQQGVLGISYKMTIINPSEKLFKVDTPFTRGFSLRGRLSGEDKTIITIRLDPPLYIPLSIINMLFLSLFFSSGYEVPFIVIPIIGSCYLTYRHSVDIEKFSMLINAVFETNQ